MDALFHFIFPLMAALAARIHMKHGIPAVLMMASTAVLIDIDHFMGPGLGGAMFHNLFFTLAVPFTILSIMYTWGGETERQASLCLLLFLFSHTILDLFSEGTVALFYPITNMQFGISANFWIGGYQLISSSGIGLLIYFSILLVCFFLQDIDRLMVKY
ncbi:MAG TPA: metal-dependent hydrolase [archaeon]|nr:metal-dependent hydrolase [archaeon]